METETINLAHITRMKVLPRHRTSCGEERGCSHNVRIDYGFASVATIELPAHEIVRLFHARKLMLRLKPTTEHILQSCWDDAAGAKAMCLRHAQCVEFSVPYSYLSGTRRFTIKYGTSYNAKPLQSALDKMLRDMEESEREVKMMQETVKRWKQSVE